MSPVAVAAAVVGSVGVAVSVPAVAVVVVVRWRSRSASPVGSSRWRFVVGDVVAVGDFVVVGRRRWVLVVLGDFDGDGMPCLLSAPTLLPGTPAPAVLTGCEGLVDELLVAPPATDVWVGAVVLLAGPDAALPLLEISTAMIATTPMAAAPIPANKKVRVPQDYGTPGIRSASFW